MAQSLWYLRHAGQMFGPFPVPQIEEALQSGEINLDWEISLNQSDWLRIAECAQFNSEKTAWVQGVSDETAAWREQRQMARDRWLREEGSSITQVAHDPEADAAARNSVVRDSIRTHALLQAEKAKPASPWIVRLAVLLIAGIGITIWLGESKQPIQTSIGQVVECKSGLTSGVNWTDCDRRGYQQPGAQARNARLDRAVIDDSVLKDVDLAYASLKQTSLRNAQLVNAKLTGADLSGADLTGADLSGADLSYAVLTGAHLTGVRFNSTRLDKATWGDGRVCAPGSVDVCL
jgi:hypothetical protein